MAQDSELTRGKSPDEKTVTGKAKEAGTAKPIDEAAAIGPDGFGWLVEQHKLLQGLVTECEQVDGALATRQLLPRVTEAWDRHAAVHGLLHDALRGTELARSPLFAQLAIQIDLVSMLLAGTQRNLQGVMRQAGLQVAGQLIGQIIEREQKRGGLLAKAKAAGVDARDLGEQIDAFLVDAEEAHRAGSDHRRRDRGRPDRDEMDWNEADRQAVDRYLPDRYGRDRFGRDDRVDRDDPRRYLSDRGRSDHASPYDIRGYDTRRYEDDRRYGHERWSGGWYGDPDRHPDPTQRGWRSDRDDDDRYGPRERGRGWEFGPRSGRR